MKSSVRTRRLSRTTLAAFVLAASALSGSPAFAAVGTYEIDRAHSSITFRIRHLLSKVPGQYRKFQGTIEIDPETRDTVNVKATIDASSISTEDEKRDEHLKSPDFFDTAKFPKITFEGSKLTDVNSDRTRGKLHGNLTIRDVTKPVVLDVEWYGKAVDPFKNEKLNFSGTTTLNRKDFGIVWNKNLDAGGYLIGDEVQVEINIEAMIPKPVQ